MRHLNLFRAAGKKAGRGPTGAKGRQSAAVVHEMKKVFSPLLATLCWAPSLALFGAEVSKEARPVAPANSATPSPAKAPPVEPDYQPAPTLPNVSYGPHPKQVIHFWKAESAKPAPLLLFIHGGGWQGGNRSSGLYPSLLKEMLEAGISVASVEYRFIAEATADGMVPPVKGPLSDAARALQFVRSKAAEWNIDKTRIAASGGSAGACSSLWLAFHDDLADPKSADPVARESTRLLCAAVNGAQTTLDPAQMVEWTPNSRYGAHAFGITGDNAKKTSAFAEFLAKRESILPWIAEYSPYALVSAGDPPVYLFYGNPPAMGKEEKDPTHTANFGVGLQERCKAAGVDCELVYPNAPAVVHPQIADYLKAKLKANPAQ